MQLERGKMVGRVWLTIGWRGQNAVRKGENGGKGRGGRAGSTAWAGWAAAYPTF